MEDALVRLDNLGVGSCLVSLNPCFNGRCTRTAISEVITEQIRES